MPQTNIREKINILNLKAHT